MKRLTDQREKRARSGRMKRSFLLTVAGIVVFFTTYLLILPALTIDKEAASDAPGMSWEMDGISEDNVEIDEKQIDEVRDIEGIESKASIPGKKMIDDPSQWEAGGLFEEDSEVSGYEGEVIGNIDDGNGAEGLESLEDIEEETEGLIESTTVGLGALLEVHHEEKEDKDAGRTTLTSKGETGAAEVAETAVIDDLDEAELGETVVIADLDEAKTERITNESEPENRSDIEELTEKKEAKSASDSEMMSETEAVSETADEIGNEADIVTETVTEEPTETETEAKSATEPESESELESGTETETESEIETETELETELETEPESETETEEETFTLSARGEDYTVVLTYHADAMIPENAGVTVEEIMPGTQVYEDYIALCKETLDLGEEDELPPELARLFDISIMADIDGEMTEVEPKGAVGVQILYDAPVNVESTEQMSVMHFAENQEAPEVLGLSDVQTGEEDGAAVTAIAFDTTSFSKFLVLLADAAALKNTTAAVSQGASAQYFFAFNTAILNNEDETKIHYASEYSPHFLMPGNVNFNGDFAHAAAGLSGSIITNPPSDAQWKAQAQQIYGLSDEDIKHLKVTWKTVSRKTIPQNENGTQKNDIENSDDHEFHVDGVLSWESGYTPSSNANLRHKTIITASIWWPNTAPPESCTVVLMKKATKQPGQMFDGWDDVIRRTYSADSDSHLYDLIFTGLDGDFSDYAMRVEGLSPEVWNIQYFQRNDENGRGVEKQSYQYATAFNYSDDVYKNYGYKLLAKAEKKSTTTGKLKIYKKTTADDGTLDLTPADTQFHITGTRRNASTGKVFELSVRYGDFKDDPNGGGKYLIVDYLPYDTYTVEETGAEIEHYSWKVKIDNEVKTGSKSSKDISEGTSEIEFVFENEYTHDTNSFAVHKRFMQNNPLTGKYEYVPDYSSADTSGKIYFHLYKDGRRVDEKGEPSDKIFEIKYTDMIAAPSDVEYNEQVIVHKGETLHWYKRINGLPEGKYTAVECDSYGTEFTQGNGEEHYTCLEFEKDQGYTALTLKNDLVSVAAYKNWQDVQGEHPDVQFTLYRTTHVFDASKTADYATVPDDQWEKVTNPGIEGFKNPLSLNEDHVPDNNLKVVWQNLPKYDYEKKQKYTYKVVEEPVAGYTSTWELKGGENGFNFYNTPEGNTSLEVEKKWVNAQGEEEAWPEGCSIDYKVVRELHFLKDNGDGTYSITDEVLDGTGDVVELDDFNEITDSLDADHPSSIIKGLPAAKAGTRWDDKNHKYDNCEQEFAKWGIWEDDVYGKFNVYRIGYVYRVYETSVTTPDGIKKYDMNSAISTEASGNAVLLKATLTNRLADISIHKVDESDQPLKGASFELLKGKDRVTEFTIDSEKGIKEIRGLLPGKYTLRETAAPAGYNQLARDIEFSVNDDGAIIVESEKFPTGVAFNTKEGEITSVYVTNITGARLPETGGIGTTIFYLAGAILVVLAGILIITKVRVDAKMKQREKIEERSRKE